MTALITSHLGACWALPLTLTQLHKCANAWADEILRLVSVSVAVLTGARSEESGMLSRTFLPKLRLSPQAVPTH